MKDTSPNVFAGTEKSVKVVINLFTMKVAVVVPDAYLSLLAWNAVMVVVPAPTMVIVVPTIVATVVSELV